MGDRSYQNRYNPFVAQNYDYNQYHQPMSYPTPNIISSQGGGFIVNTNTPIFNTGAPDNQVQNSSRHSDQFRNRSEQFGERPPPSYEESHNDTLLAKSKHKVIPSPAWSYIDDRVEEKQAPKSSFSSLFDIPRQTVKKSPDWSSDNYSSSYSYQQNMTGRFNHHNSFTQVPSVSFSSDYGARSKRFSQQAEFSKYRGRGRGGFRQNNQQNKVRSQDGGNQQGYDQYTRGTNMSNWSEDNFNGKSMDFDKQPHGNDGEGKQEDGGGGGNNDTPDKSNVFVPDPSLVKLYEYYPPGPQEMGEMFKDLVIHFFYRNEKGRLEQNPFVIACEAFRRSASFSDVNVEDGYDFTFKDRKFCTIRYKGMMMVRGVGENGCLKEPRVVAGVELINKLAMSCYTLKSKVEYYKDFDAMLEKGSVPGVFTIVPKEEANDFLSSCKYVQNVYSKEDSDVEYWFHLPVQEANKFRNWANKQNPKLDARTIRDDWIGICRRRTLQYLRDKILASGSMETARYILKPPQGIGNLLLPNFDIKEAVGTLRARQRLEPTIQNVYGPPGVGPNIRKALPPWERGGNNKNKNNRKKEKKIMKQIRSGVPVNEVKEFKYLSQKRKKKLRNKFAK